WSPRSCIMTLRRPPGPSHLSLHDALPICVAAGWLDDDGVRPDQVLALRRLDHRQADAVFHTVGRVLILQLGDDRGGGIPDDTVRSEEHTSELQSRENLVCRLLLEKKNEQT